MGDGGPSRNNKRKLPQTRRWRWYFARVGESRYHYGPATRFRAPLGAPTGGMVGNSRLGGGFELLSCLAIPLGAGAKVRVGPETTTAPVCTRIFLGFAETSQLCDAYAFSTRRRLTTPDPEAIERFAGSIWPVKERRMPRVELMPRRCPPTRARSDSTSRRRGTWFLRDEYA